MGGNKGVNETSSRVSYLPLMLIAMVLLGWTTACNRQNGPLRYASTTSDSAASNPPLNVAPPSTTAAPGISYADVVSRASPAVITIHSTMQVRAPEQFPFMDDPMFREFFGERGRPPQQAPRRREGLGSGVIVTQDGYILTNHHVIDGAEQIKVNLNDNRTLDARLVGSDPPSDLALLKVEATNLPVLTLGDSDRTRVGDVVLAIGNPMGIGQTVTMGIISAKGRTTGLSAGNFEDFLQTDAPINQGNSGGALVSTNSELIGINSQILSQSGGSIGIGFAIPSNMARTVMESLARSGKVRRGQLGIVVAPITADRVEKLNLRDQNGVFVARVPAGGAAERAGVQPNDVIIRFNGTQVNDPNTFRNLVAGTAPGTDVTLTIVRDGREQQINARLGEFTPQVPRAER
jgi:Do/DeqQ family serine protease